MGIAFILLSAFSFALETVLLTHFFRKHNSFLTIGLRGMGIMAAGLLVLPFVDFQKLLNLQDYIFPLVFAAFFAVIGNWGYVRSTRHFPVGIANALVTAVQVAVMIALGWIFAGERLSLIQFLAIGGIVASNSFIYSQKYFSEFVFHPGKIKGLFLVMVNGLFMSFAFFILAFSAREYDPLISGYIWECLIGIMALMIAIPSAFRSNRKGNVLSLERGDVISILIRSFPALLGTLFYAKAVTLLPLAITQAIFTSLVLFTAVLGRILYKEKLTNTQWLALVFVILMIAALKLYSQPS